MLTTKKLKPTELKSVLRYNRAIQSIELHELLSPCNSKDSDMPRFPKRKKLYRTLSLASELRALQKDYFYFHDNAIALEFLNGGNYQKKTVLIVSTEDCYKVRVDIWGYSKGGGHFYYKEIEQPTGNRLLWELVSLEILDTTYLPKITKHHDRINDL